CRHGIPRPDRGRQVGARQRVEPRRHARAVQRSRRQAGEGEMNTSFGHSALRGTGWLIALLVMAAPLAAAVIAATRGTPIPLSLGSGSELWLEGTSTLHEYQSRTKDLTLTMARDSAEADPAGTDQLVGLMQASKIRAVDVEVPVKSLHSPKGAGL